jgi:ribosomal protein S27AE
MCGKCGTRAIFTEKEGIEGRLADEGWIHLSEKNPLCPYCAGIKTQEGFFRILENMEKMGGK